MHGLILAGGRGTRLGGLNKGLQPFAGKQLVEHALARLHPQVQSVCINANADIAAYQKLDLPVAPSTLSVVRDAPDTLYQGPLAGILAGLRMRTCTKENAWLLCVPCDTPCFPLNLGQRLWQALATVINTNTNSEQASHHASIPRSAFVAEHPVFCLLHQSLAQHLAQFLAQGGRKVRVWHAQAGAVALPWDDERAFVNLNRIEDWEYTRI